MLRGSRDFASRDSYAAFLRQLFGQQNAGRPRGWPRKWPLLRPLPSQRLEACKRLPVRVDTRQHHPSGEQHLLGGQPADRRVGGGPFVRRARRSLVRPEAGGAAAAAAWTWQASHRLPARHRLAGPQAGGVRRLSLPCGSVSQQPLPHGLRRAAAAAAGAGGQGIPADSAPGGTRERGGSRGGVGGTAGSGRPYGCGRREGEAASAKPDPAGHRGDGGGGGPGRV